MVWIWHGKGRFRKFKQLLNSASFGGKTALLKQGRAGSNSVFPPCSKTLPLTSSLATPMSFQWCQNNLEEQEEAAFGGRGDRNPQREKWAGRRNEVSKNAIMPQKKTDGPFLIKQASTSAAGLTPAFLQLFGGGIIRCFCLITPQREGATGEGWGGGFDSSLEAQLSQTTWLGGWTFH